MILNKTNNDFKDNENSFEETKNSMPNIDKIEEQIIFCKIKISDKILFEELLLIAYLSNFSYKDIEFSDLPIAFEYFEGKLNTFCIWFDDGLHKQLERYNNNFKVAMNKEDFKISCLPASVLEKPELHEILKLNEFVILKMVVSNDSLRFNVREELIHKHLGDSVEITFIKSYLLNVHVYEFNSNKFRIESFLPPQINFVNIK